MRESDRISLRSGAPHAWAAYCDAAVAALKRRFAEAGELPPAAVARIVAGVLPRRHRAWLLSRLRRLGWLDARSVVPCDALDFPQCPFEFRGALRELARLAVFGLPGQGVPYREKHRQDVYQQLCAQILSGAVDTASLQSVAARALSHPDVSADPVLASMVRSFIAQREAALRAARSTPADQQRQKEEESKLRAAFQPAAGQYPTREELVAQLARLQRDFDAHLAQFDEHRARDVLNRMLLLRQRFPVHVAITEVQRCEEQLDRLLRRAGMYRRQLADLAGYAARAARAGDEKTAQWVTRRLEAVHRLLPNLLPTPDLERLRANITRLAAVRETQEVAEVFRARQQAVAAKIRDLAGVVHRFHELAARLPPQDEAYQRAEANYRQAVAEIRTLDTDWLSGLVIELETLLDDLDDSTGQAHSQLDAFIANVRTALNRLCLEIRAHRAGKTNPPTSEDTRPATK